ncbi:MAG: hypothetical protein ACLP8S_05555, partial [Solirubrobacteraceae bacterium]
PPLPDVPNVLAIELKFTVGHANVLSRVHVNYASAAPTRHILNEYAASIDGQIAAYLIPLFSTEVRTAEIVVTDLTSRTSHAASPKAGRSARGPACRTVPPSPR